MLTPEQVENIAKMSKSTTFGAETNVRLLIETIEGLAEGLDDMIGMYDSARYALRRCGSEDHNAFDDDETKLEDAALQAWVDKARHPQTVYKLRIKDGGEEKVLRLSHEAASELARKLTHYTESCVSVILDVTPIPEGDERS